LAVFAAKLGVDPLLGGSAGPAPRHGAWTGCSPYRSEGRRFRRLRNNPPPGAKRRRRGRSTHRSLKRRARRGTDAVAGTGAPQGGSWEQSAPPPWPRLRRGAPGDLIAIGQTARLTGDRPVAAASIEGPPGAEAYQIVVSEAGAFCVLRRPSYATREATADMDVVACAARARWVSIAGGCRTRWRAGQDSTRSPWTSGQY